MLLMSLLVSLLLGGFGLGEANGLCSLEAAFRSTAGLRTGSKGKATWTWDLDRKWPRKRG